MGGVLRWLKLSKTSHRLVLDSLSLDPLLNLISEDARRMSLDEYVIEVLKRREKEVVFLVPESEPRKPRGKPEINSEAYGLDQTHFFTCGGLFLGSAGSESGSRPFYFNPSSHNKVISHNKMTIEVRVRDYTIVPNWIKLG